MARTTIPAELVAINAIQGTLIADNAITAVHIATNAVSGTLVADNAITSTHIAQNNVTATQIANNTITVTQLADNAVETDKINNDAVTQAKIADDAVGPDQLAANAVVSASIANGTIVAADLADDAVTIAKMAALARGKIIYGDSSGAPAALALGSNGQVLTTDGTDISWGAASGGTDPDGAQVFNESGAAVDFRIEGDTQQNLFFVDGSADKIYIGDNASHTDDFLQIETPASGGGHGIQLRRNDSNNDQQVGRILFGNNTDTDLAQLAVKTDGANDNAAMLFSTQPDGGALTERMRIDHDGNVGIGTSSPDYRFVIKGAAATNDNVFKIEDSAGVKMASMEQDSSGNGRWIVCDTSGNADVLIHTAGASYFNGGNVGIGCTPGQLFTVEGSSPQMEFRNTANSYHYLSFVNSSATSSYNDMVAIGAEIDSGSAKGRLVIKTRASDGSGSQYERMRINNTGGVTFTSKHQGDTIGNVMITSQVGDSPNTSENCQLSVKNGGQMLQVMAWAGLGARIGTRTGGWDSNSGGNCYLTGQDATCLVLKSNGTAYLANGSTAVTSDQRLKKDITDMADGQLAKINSLKVRNFKWKDARRPGTQTGLIAQEVESVIADAIEETEIAPDPDDTSRDFSGDVKIVKYGDVQMRLLKAVQELSADLDAAKARIKTLEDA